MKFLCTPRRSMERFLDTNLSDWEPEDRYKRIYCCDPDAARKPVPVPENIRFRQDQPLPECEETNECKCRVCRCKSCNKRETLSRQRGSSSGPCSTVKPRKTTSTSPLREFDATMKVAMNKKRFPRLDDEDRPDDIGSGILHPILARSIRRGFNTERASPPGSMAESKLWSVAKQFTEMDKVYRYEQTLRAAERAAQMAPPDRREEAALAGAQDYSINVVERRGVQEEPDCVIEVVSYMGITRPYDDQSEINECNN